MVFIIPLLLVMAVLFAAPQMVFGFLIMAVAVALSMTVSKVFIGKPNSR
jgi:hypothetical protein